MMDYSAAARVGGSACLDLEWTSDSSLRCSVYAGVSGTRRVTATVGQVSGTLSSVVSFDIPSVSSTLPGNGPLTGAVSVSLTGANFGDVDTSPEARIGITSCVGLWVSDSVTVCVLAPGRRAPHNLMVSVGVQVGTLSAAFCYDGPVPSSALPVNAPTSGMVSFSLTGTNFGVHDYTQKTRVGGTSCLDTEWTSDTSVRGHLSDGVQAEFNANHALTGDGGGGLGKSVTVTVGEMLGTHARVFF
jgi:hypothetical protein